MSYGRGYSPVIYGPGGTAQLIPSGGLNDSIGNPTGTPVGTIIANGSTSTPDGYLYCNGAAVSRTTYAGLFTAIASNFGEGDASTTFNVPELRGQFLRGQDDSEGVDPDAAGRSTNSSGGNTGDNVGSQQVDAFKSHLHNWDQGNAAASGSGAGVAGDAAGSASSAYISLTGGNETRPVNVGVRYYIKF